MRALNMPIDLIARISRVEGHLVAILIRAQNPRGAAFDHQPNLSANWISLPGVDVVTILPAVDTRLPVASKISV
jgi:hypothetical protein